MPSLFRVKRALCRAADGVIVSVKVGDKIDENHPMFMSFKAAELEKIGQTPDPVVESTQMRNPIPEPEPAPEPEPTPDPMPEPDPIPDPIPPEENYRRVMERKPKEKEPKESKEPKEPVKVRRRR